jgi:phospholipid/cholesterol/gamma-HCH transport system substrate-binding protein
MERTTLDLWVGIFVVMGLAALVVLGFKVGNLGTYDSNDTYKIVGQFENIGGLKIKAPVKSAGVVVGRVSAISFDQEKFLAHVELRVDSRYHFPRDTSAAILTSGLLGEQYIGLEAGGDPASLKDGDQFKLTQSAMVLENLIGQMIYSKASEGGEKPAAQ